MSSKLSRHLYIKRFLVPLAICLLLVNIAIAEEFSPLSVLKQDALGKQLININNIAETNPQQALKEIQQLKDTTLWQSTPETQTSYYRSLFAIYNALSNPKLAEQQINALFQYANAQQIPWVIAEANFYLALVQAQFHGAHNQALKYIEQAMPIALSLNYQHLIGRLYNLRASSLQNSGKNEQALLDYHQAIKILGNYPQEGHLPMIYSNMSIIYMAIEDWKKGLEYNKSAFEDFTTSGKENPRFESILLLNKAIFLKNLDRKQEELATLKQAKVAAKKSGSVRLIINVQVNLSETLLENEHVEEAKLLAQQCIYEATKHQINYLLIHCNSNMGRIEAALGNYVKAIQLLSKAKDDFKKEDNLKEMVNQQRHLSDVYEMSGDYYNALRLYKDYYKNNTEIMFNERSNNLLKLQEGYETQLKENKINLLSAENQLKSSRLEQEKLNNRIWTLVSVFSLLILTYLIRRYILINRHANELEKSNTKLFQRSLIDPLTKIANRRAVEKHIKTFNSNKFEIDLPHCITLIDIDHFKKVNDTHGHGVGDEVIVAIAERLKSQIRQNDMLARWGGEEFVLLVENPDNIDPYLFVNRMIKAINGQPINTSAGPLNITISAGAKSATMTEINSKTWPELLHNVDMALYHAKESGRNQAKIA